SEEYAAMKRHARLGRDILMSIAEEFEAIADGAWFVTSIRVRFQGVRTPLRPEIQSAGGIEGLMVETTP
ncbi:MAG: hypothetical protein P8Z81_16335, partial [Deinococcales bacterium]